MAGHLRLALLGSILATALCATPLLAQGGSSSESAATAATRGRRNTHTVRMATGEEITGRLEELGPDVLRLVVGGERREFKLDDVLQVDRDDDPLKNGAIIGAAVLGTWCAIVCGQGLDSGSQLPVAVAVNAGFGALIGAGIDKANRHRTTIYRKPSGGKPTASGASLMLSYRLWF